jgi:gliding motility-associated-like protein
MKKYSTFQQVILLLVLLFSTSQIQAQFNATPLGGPLTPTALVQNNLVGQGVTISNVTIAAGSDNRQYGTFTNANSNLPFSSGIFLCTGYVDEFATQTNVAPGGFNSTDPTCVFGNGGICSPGDPDLAAIIAPFASEDAAVLEFDFTPLSDTVRFRYVFASEEYDEYACSQFNDVFAFFVDGPGVPLQNIAIIPGTTLPVAINTVNNGTPGQFASLPHNCNAPTGSLAYSSLYQSNPVLGANVEFDGMTVVLEAVVAVIPCSTYHMKIAVSDASDGILDSGVFLEANSFSSDAVVINSITADGDTTTTEACDTASFVFELSSPVSQDSTIYFTIGGTATNGVDYQQIADSVVILSGDSTALVTIIPIGDGIPDNNETVTVSVTSGLCVTITSTATLYIDEESILPPPSGLSCTVTGPNSVQYSWDPIVGATGYEVSLDSGQTWIPAAPGPLTHDVTGLASGGVANIFVRGVGGLQVCNENPYDSLLCSACAISVNIDTIINVSCNGGSDGSATVSAIGSNPPFTYTWDAATGSQTGQTASGLPSGIYTVSVTDATACQQSINISVSEPSAISITNTIIDADCNGASTGAIDIEVSGGTVAGCSSSSVVINEFMPNPAGPNDGVDPNASEYIELIGPPGTDIGCYVLTDGDWSITIPPGTTIPADGIFTIGNDAVYGAGTFDLDAENCGCFVDGIGGSGLLVLTTAGEYLAIFDGTGTFLSGVIYGTPTATNTPPLGATAVGGVMPTAGLAGCLTSVTIPAAASFTNIGLPSIDGDAYAVTPDGSSNWGYITGGTLNSCNAPSSGTGSYSYVWSSTQTTQDISGLSAGTYTVTVTDGNNCPAIETYTVSEPSAITLTTSTTDALCFGGSDGTASVVAAGGTVALDYTYAWDDTNTQSTATATGLAAGTYNVTVTDDNGCTMTTSATVGQPAAGISLTMTSTDALCYNQASGTATATPAGGTAPYTYSWEDNQTTQTAVNLVADTYSVTMTDDNGCIGIDSVVVGNAPIITQSATTTDALCNGASDGTATHLPLGGAGGFTYLWDNGQTTQTATGLAAGTHCVTATDINGCTTDTCVTVAEPTALSNNAFVTAPISCDYTSDGTATINMTGGTSPYNYAWSNGQTTQTATGLDTMMYYVTVTDANSCTFIDSIQLTAPLALVLTLDADSVGCRFGSDGSILSTVVGGTPAYSYAWSNGPTVANNTNLSAGFYDLTVTDANGCTATETVEVGQPASAVIANILSTSDASCFGSSDGSIDADALGGTPNYTFAWSNGQLTEDLSGLAAGTYTVTATDANGCTASTTTTIGQPSQIITNIQQYSNYNGAAISCPGAADGALQVTASGGQSPYTFAWSGANPQNTQIASNLAEGTYVVTVTDASGCSVLDSFTIFDPVPLQATETHVDVFCNGDCDGQILVNAVSGTGTLGINGYEYNITGPGQTGNVFSATNSFFGLCAGTYTVTVRDGNNCTLPVSITIAEPAALAATTATTDVSCNGGIDGSATVTATGGVAPYTYNWSNGQTTQTAVNLAAGGYDVTITDDNGCDLVTSVVLTEPTAMAGTTTFDEPSCNGGTDGSATVSVTGGTAPYTYLWNTGSTNATAIGLGAGSYTVTSTDANGCQLINTVTVSQPQAIAVTISGSGLTCSGNGSGSATANPTGGTAPYTYLWSDGQTTATATGLNASTYTVLVVDANGCSINAQTTLSQPTPVVATQVSSTDISCNGGADGSATVMGSGGSAPYTYNWDNGQTGATATGLAAGTYTATITDANGCDATISVNIFEPAILEIPQITTTNVNCKGGSDGTASAFVNGGTFPYSFSWSNGETTQVINNLAAGTYFVTVTDGNGCTANSSVIITEPSAFLVGVINVNDALCDGTASGQLAAVISGGTLPASGDYTYVWSNGASTPVVSAVTAGTYSLTVIDANGCTLDLSATVGNGGSINANIVASADASCFGGNDGSATVTATGGTGGLTYQWSDPAGQTNPTATNLAAGTYYVTVNDANGCAVVDSVTVGEADAFTINTNVTDVACFGENSGQLSITGASVTPGQILWSNAQVGNAASNLSAGAYSVTVTSIDGCTQTFNYNITQPTALELSIDQTSPILCNDDSTGALAATVNGGTANYSYSWTDGVNGPNRSNLPAGTYTLQVTDANGCTVAEVSQLGNPTAIGFSFVDAMGVACVGDNNGFIQVQGTGGSTALGNYEYSLDGQNWQSGNLFPNLTDGQYDIYVRDQNGCIAEDSVEVAAADSFLITAFNTTLDSTGVVEYGDSINLEITLNEPTGAVVSWIELNNGTTLDSALAILVNPTEASIYRFTAVSPAGCVVDTSLTVQVDKPRRASAPTAFTPNSDGTNDAFFIQAEAERVSQVQSFRVYDRWGELVFESVNTQPNDPQAGWDGTFKGKPMQGGVFAWYAEVEFIDGHVEVLRGEVTLLR